VQNEAFAKNWRQADLTPVFLQHVFDRQPDRIFLPHSVSLKGVGTFVILEVENEESVTLSVFRLVADVSTQTDLNESVAADFFERQSLLNEECLLVASEELRESESRNRTLAKRLSDVTRQMRRAEHWELLGREAEYHKDLV
jgi:hypothetical protein